MSLQTVAKKFVELCSQGKTSMSCARCTSRRSSPSKVEARKPPARQRSFKKSEVWQANHAIHVEKVRGPFFNGPNQFAVHLTFEVTRKATGKRITLEEVGVYTVKDDKIAGEQFFYDGEH